LEVSLLIEELNNLRNIYNIEKETIIQTLEKILYNEFNMGEIVILNNRIYEKITKNNNSKLRKIRLSKKNINIIKDLLTKELNKISIKNKVKILKNKYFLNVIKGKIIGKNNFAYIIEFNGEIGFLYFNKSKKEYEIGDIDYFHINKIKYNDKELLVILDDSSSKITQYIIYNELSGIYIKKFFIKGKKIILYTNTKIEKKKIKELEEILVKKQIIIKDKNE